jgi:hypothetical protein
MRTNRLAGLAFLLLSGGFSAAEAAAERNATYAELRAAKPQGEAIAVQNLAIERDVFRFRFDTGSFQFLTLADGRTVGAVFVGDGGLELKPAIEAERRQLALVTGEKGLEVLSDRFDSAVLLFTDATAAEIRQKSAVAASSPGFSEIYETFFRKQRKEIRSNLQLRLLRDLLATPAPASGVFMAYLPGRKYPPGLALLDPAGLGWLVTDLLLSGEEVCYRATTDSDSGWWYLAHRKTEPDPLATHPANRSARALHYSIETTIKSNAEIRGTTVIQIKPLASGERVLGLNLLGKLRLQEASFSESDAGPWQPVTIVQEEAEEDSDAAVVFGSPLGAEKILFLRLTYAGKGVLREDGNGIYSVGARESWYPNVTVFAELAAYQLTYRFPKNLQVISVGAPVDEHVDGDQKVSIWKQDRPIRVAGFNYGKFRKLEHPDPESGVHVDIYASENRGNLELLEDSATADSLNTARVGTHYFGPLTENRISITQQSQFSFGQSFPSLIYLPSSVAFDTPNRRSLLTRDKADFVDRVGSHEFAHQWWGHLVGWASYRDQWLSEGFAEFTSALVVEHASGLKGYDSFWERARTRVIEKKPPAFIANDEAGPMTQGWRLATRKNWSAAQAMIYTKGAYALHMLRMMMRGRAPDPDAKFIALMKDFASSYAGRNPTTRDFQKIVERHMVPAMNLKGDGKMDWFFNQWVYGMEIPRYRAKLDVAPVSGDQYKIVGSVAQESVSPDFASLVHVYAEFAKGELAHLGSLSVVGSATTPVDVTVKLPKAPKRIVLNAFHDVLSRD